MARVARAIHCQLDAPQRASILKRESASVSVQLPAPKMKPAGEPENSKIMLQPRLCTLRSYGEDRFAVVKTRKDGGDEVSRFFETLSDYIESSKKSHDFEIISGRLAMMVFAATVTTEWVTGNSIFGKVEIQGIEEAGGVCLVGIICSATFAYFSSARNRVGGIFKSSCNTLIDSLIDDIVDGLFYNDDDIDI
ncbi:stress enhanced protein 2, chloroplastic [Euphorbia lathyris]|uniref:stress enhanced protein 2, chloroplastic n=1 Tax=Euphorbia lathyris TaxID=212925 RepID=UPI0033135B88